MNQRMTRRRRILCIATATGLCLATGCSRKTEPPHPFSLTGRVVAIDTTKGTITVEYEHPKTHLKRTDTAQVGEETEIHIDGALGTLSDVHLGEHVRGDVLVRGKGKARRLDVLKIYVERRPG